MLIRCGGESCFGTHSGVGVRLGIGEHAVSSAGWGGTLAVTEELSRCCLRSARHIPISTSISIHVSISPSVFVSIDDPASTIYPSVSVHVGQRGLSSTEVSGRRVATGVVAVLSAPGRYHLISLVLLSLHLSFFLLCFFLIQVFRHTAFGAL